MVLRNTQEWTSKLEKIQPSPPTQPQRVSREPDRDDPPYREKPPGGPPWPGYPNPPPPDWIPPQTAGLMDDLKIDPTGHKGAQKKQKIYNKATDPAASGSEKDWLKKTGPQLPLADSRALRDHLKPHTKGQKDYDKVGGSLRDVPDEQRIQLLKEGKGLV